MLTARRSIRMTACGFLPRNRGTPCVESGLQKKKRKAITTVSPTKASGRFAILRTRGRFFRLPTGSITRRQTGSLRRPSWRRWTARNSRCFWPRTTERMLEKHPYQGKFTFVQIGAPSRTHIKRYHDLLADVEAESERINWRFQTSRWKPIVFLKRHYSHKEIQRYYQTADLCLVTSLHDGMNLVAKEFVAARHDEQGVLILSRFTGAARELRDAVLVNPYDVEQTAEAIRYSLEMEPE